MESTKRKIYDLLEKYIGKSVLSYSVNFTMLTGSFKGNTEFNGKFGIPDENDFGDFKEIILDDNEIKIN